jgi:hypothetical protein
MTFSYRLDNTAAAIAPSSSSSSNDSSCGGGVHLSIGYFSLPNESNSGIWHYNFLRCMLRGFMSGLCHELELIPPTSSSSPSSSNNVVRYVNMGTHEDYVKHSCGAVGALWEHSDVVARVCPVGFFTEIGRCSDREDEDDELQQFGWLSVKPEI